MKFHLLCFRIPQIRIYQADYQQSSDNLPSRVRDEEHLVMNHFPWLNILLINDDDTPFLFSVTFSDIALFIFLQLLLHFSLKKSDCSIIIHDQY